MTGSAFRIATSIATNIALIFGLWGCEGGGGQSNDLALEFAEPSDCAGCHPRQFAEWRGSMMAYASRSPVFGALELSGNQLLGGVFAAHGEQDLLCQRCHSPISVALDELPTFAESGGRPLSEFAGPVGSHGVSCDFCHQVPHADFEGSLLGDGIANVALFLSPGLLKYGPFVSQADNPRHDMEESAFLSSSQFCGGCHDVRLNGDDEDSGEPFLRLEDAFSEWERGPYSGVDNPFGRVVSCQDCHMSLFPYEAPGTYPRDEAAVFPGVPVRDVSTHYFTGVDLAFIDLFPGQQEQAASGDIDSHGVPSGQAQRRQDLLRAACTVEIKGPDNATAGGQVALVVEVTNVGAGHNVPTGFSQERQMWIEITVEDDTGMLVYESGFLRDRAHPETGELEVDGNLDDEDLQDLIGELDPVTMEAMLELGPDHDERPARNRGLKNFGNRFERIAENGDSEEVFSPFLANHIDNSFSIEPLATASVPYDIDLPQNTALPLHVNVRLRFRAFPPRFLRSLAQAHPDLVTEEIVDKNRVVDMAESSLVISAAP